MEISPFDHKDFFKKNKHFSSIICGSRRSGKSYLVKYLFKKNKFNEKFDYIIIMCNSSELEKYKEYVKGELFFHEFDPDVIDRLFILADHNKENYNEKNYLIILDDSISNTQLYSQSLDRIFSRGRHSNISLILTTQKMSMASTMSRSNSDVVFLGGAKSSLEKKAYINNFLYGEIEFPEGVNEEKALIKIIKESTKDFNFLVIDYNKDQILYSFKAG